jgi:hypothetical protein
MSRYIYWTTLLIIHTWSWSLSWEQICLIISFRHFSPLFTLHLHCHLHRSLVPCCHVMSTNNCLIANLYWISFFNHFFSFHSIFVSFYFLSLCFSCDIWLSLCLCYAFSFSFCKLQALTYIALQHTNPICFNVFCKIMTMFLGIFLII